MLNENLTATALLIAYDFEDVPLRTCCRRCINNQIETLTRRIIDDGDENNEIVVYTRDVLIPHLENSLNTTIEEQENNFAENNSAEDILNMFINTRNSNVVIRFQDISDVQPLPQANNLLTALFAGLSNNSLQDILNMSLQNDSVPYTVDEATVTAIKSSCQTYESLPVNDKTSCCICLDEFQKEQMVFVCKHCHNRFCQGTSEELVETSTICGGILSVLKSSDTCPTCRNTLV